MPTWLILTLVLLGGVVLVALQAAAVTGRWRNFWVGAKQYGTYLLIAFLLPGALVAAYLFMVG
jgi:hypothetical protein